MSTTLRIEWDPAESERTSAALTRCDLAYRITDSVVLTILLIDGRDLVLLPGEVVEFEF